MINSRKVGEPNLNEREVFFFRRSDFSEEELKEREIMDKTLVVCFLKQDSHLPFKRYLELRDPASVATYIIAFVHHEKIEFKKKRRYTLPFRNVLNAWLAAGGDPFQVKSRGFFKGYIIDSLDRRNDKEDFCENLTALYAYKNYKRLLNHHKRLLRTARGVEMAERYLLSDPDQGRVMGFLGALAQLRAEPSVSLHGD